MKTEKQYQPHEHRVIDEQKELYSKIEKLKDFLSSDFFNSNLKKEDKDLLREQYAHMKSYNRVLNDRINKF